MIYNLIFVALFLLGFYPIFMSNSLIKMVIGLNIMESSVFFWAISMSSNKGLLPIIESGVAEGIYTDPVPQALVLTGIVIGASTTALLLTLVIELNKLTGTIKPDEVKGLGD